MTVKGRDSLRRYLLSDVPKRIEAVLQGAAKAGATVIKEEAKLRCNSPLVSEAIRVKAVDPDGAKATAKVVVVGRWARTLTRWMEYGTEAHFISVDDSQREGRSVSRVNLLEKTGGLVINGNFVGTTVRHPGARPVPFIRPAEDLSAPEAMAAARAYVDQRFR